MPIRILYLAGTWIVLLLVGLQMVPSARDLFDLPVLAYVLFLPWLGSLAVHTPAALTAALRDVCTSRAEELPAERRAASAVVLRGLGGLSLVAGLLGFFAAVIATFQTLTASAGQASPMEVVGGLPGMLIAPVYGLALKAFLYDFLADGLEGAETPLGAELADAGRAPPLSHRAD